MPSHVDLVVRLLDIDSKTFIEHFSIVSFSEGEVVDSDGGKKVVLILN